jgi:hypothetical protein
VSCPDVRSETQSLLHHWRLAIKMQSQSRSGPSVTAVAGAVHLQTALSSLIRSGRAHPECLLAINDCSLLRNTPRHQLLGHLLLHYLQKTQWPLDWLPSYAWLHALLRYGPHKASGQICCRTAITALPYTFLMFSAACILPQWYSSLRLSAESYVLFSFIIGCPPIPCYEEGQW